jgi:hypothetical protein
MSRATLELIARTLEPRRGRAWHGGVTPVGALRGVGATEAAWEPAPRRHSIWALALHLAYWKYAVRRHLEPEPIPRFPRSPSNWPAVPAAPDEALWRADRALLSLEHEKFVRAVRGFDPDRLHRRPPRKRSWTYGDLILGVLAHDAYHTGQIQLLKRLRSEE